MDHELQESGRKWVTKLRLDTTADTLTKQTVMPQRSPNLPNVIELSPEKPARGADIRAISTVPRLKMNRARSNSSGRIIPRVSLSPEERVEENLGLRRRNRMSTKSPKNPSNSTGLGRSQRQRPRSRYVIPAEHVCKLIWDILTVFVAIAHMRKTHEEIRDRQFAFGTSKFKIFCDAWFLVDILLNFITEKQTAEGEYLRDYRSICARYLTSWFPIDILSLFPWETLYVQPLIELQNKRGPVKKLFHRSRAVVKVIINRLRARHFRWFGNLAKHTKQHGVGYTRLFRLLVKYLPKYTLFYRNMKGIMAMRALRQVRWFGRFFKSIEKSDSSTASLSKDDGDEISIHLEDDDHNIIDAPRMRLNYENLEQLVDDDGVPL